MRRRLSGLAVSRLFFKAVRAGLTVKRPYLSNTGRASPAAADARNIRKPCKSLPSQGATPLRLW